jgi:hypothetical protein
MNLKRVVFLSRSYNKISDFKKQLIKDIGDTMNEKVSKHVQLKMDEAIEDVVYRGYVNSSMRYQRRMYGEGGLLNSKSYWHETSTKGNNIRMVTENRAKANTSDYGYHPIEGSSSQYLTPLIVYGHGGAGGYYSYGNEYPYSYTKPRDFISEARKNLRSSKSHLNALWVYLPDKGYETSIY